MDCSQDADRKLWAIYPFARGMERVTGLAPPRSRMRVWMRRLYAFPPPLREILSRSHAAVLHLSRTEERHKKPWECITWRSVTRYHAGKVSGTDVKRVTGADEFHTSCCDVWLPCRVGMHRHAVYRHPVSGWRTSHCSSRLCRDHPPVSGGADHSCSRC